MKRGRTHLSAAGFTLVEVTLALGVAAVGLVSVFGLLPVGLNTNAQSIEQTAAGNLLAAVVADLRATPATVPPGQAASSQQFSLAIPANPVATAATSTVYVTDDGKPSSTLPANVRFRLTATFISNGSASRAPTLARLKVSWPAVASPDHATGSVEQLTILDRN